MMNYSEFKIESIRKDKKSNDKVHYFSGLFCEALAYVLYRMKVSPNLATFMFLIAGVFSFLSFYLNWYVAGYFMWRIHIILDMADGAIARATKNFSKSAVGFDRSNHIIINTLIIYVFSAGQIVFLALLITFYLHYFFSRNYYSEKKGSVDYSIPVNFVKDIIGLEGYVIGGVLVVWYGEGLLYHNLFYVAAFASLYFIKLYKIIGGNK